MSKPANTRAGVSANNTADESNKKDEDNAAQPQELTRAALDELLHTENKLRDSIDAKQESKHQWRIREKGLRCSNWKLQLENVKVREQTDSLDTEILAEVEKSEKDHEELDNCKLKTRQEAADFWIYFQQETKKYSHLFPNAHLEYNADSLKKDIEIYSVKSQKLREEIAKVEGQMDSARANYGLAELGTNTDAKLLEDFNVAKEILSDKSVLLRATKSAEDNIDVLQLTVKQKKHEIAYLKNKSRRKKY